MGSATDATMLDYIIVGSGPAGIQMGYFMTKHGVNHLILESGDKHSMFTRRYPRHRTLISINKVNNFFPEDDYNMRHDWNSLLSDENEVLFTKYTDELFPDADILVDYLDDFIAKYNINIKCNCKVTKVGKLGGLKDEGFRVTCENGETFTCKRLLMATGALKENVPNIPGIEHADTYGEHSLDLAEYKNKRVCIVGAKNSAFETGDHLAASAAIVHFYTHSDVKMAWDTHFVGDLRAVNNNIIDMYHLKSLHAIRTDAEIREIKPVTKPNGETAYEIDFEMALPHWNPPGTGTFKTTYDKIIYCTGWKYILPEMYEENCVPEINPVTNGRLPLLDDHWESTVPHLFFMGTNMQARDKKSASGFIHGFRYNVRTLYHMLMNRYDQVELPHTHIKNADPAKIADYIIERTNTTSALYQMNHGFLCDMVEFKKNDDDTVDFKHYTEVPSEWVMNQKRFTEQEHLLMITLGDNRKNFSGRVNPTEFTKPPDFKIDNNKCSAFAEPILKVFNKGVITDVLYLGHTPMVRHDKNRSLGANGMRAHHRLQNLLAKHLNIKQTEELDVSFFDDEFWKSSFKVWTNEDIEMYKNREGKADEHVECSLKLFGKVN